jgi:hypothetical protein
MPFERGRVAASRRLGRVVRSAAGAAAAPIRRATSSLLAVLSVGLATGNKALSVAGEHGGFDDRRECERPHSAQALTEGARRVRRIAAKRVTLRSVRDVIRCEITLRDSGRSVIARVFLDHRGAPIDVSTTDLPEGPVRAEWRAPQFKAGSASTDDPSPDLSARLAPPRRATPTTCRSALAASCPRTMFGRVVRCASRRGGGRPWSCGWS